jgi:SAM-dependent methyltransferase
MPESSCREINFYPACSRQAAVSSLGGAHPTGQLMDLGDGYASNPLIAVFYDRIVQFGGRKDIEFYVEVAREAGGEVLEIGCGTGRILLPIAREGIAIFGIDSSAPMLEVCRQKLSAEPASVQACVLGLEVRDMRQFDLGRRFNLVTIPFHPFIHLLTVKDQIACLTAVRRHLNRGGRLVFDIYAPAAKHLVEERYLQPREEPPFTLPDGRVVVRRTRLVSRDQVRQVIDIETIYDVSHPDGRSEIITHCYPFRYVWPFEAEHLLARCGFELEHLYADYNKTPWGEKHTGEMYIVARVV